MVPIDALEDPTVMTYGAKTDKQNFQEISVYLDLNFPSSSPRPPARPL